MELEGRVTRIDRGRALVAVGDEQHSVVDNGTHDLVVGDNVRFDGETLVELLPRTSLLTRLGHDGAEQAIAANVDVVLIVAGLDRPVKPGRLLRASTQAWEAGSTPLIVLTKADLADPADALADLATQVVGVDVQVVSSVTGDGIHELLDRLAGRTAVLLGESGAGKSSLVNALTEGDELVGEVREGDAKGRHTTTWRQLVDLPGGGAVIDTPGVRSLGLWTDAERSRQLRRHRRAGRVVPLPGLQPRRRARLCGAGRGRGREPGRGAVRAVPLAAPRGRRPGPAQRPRRPTQYGKQMGKAMKEVDAERQRKGDNR